MIFIGCIGKVLQRESQHLNLNIIIKTNLYINIFVFFFNTLSIPGDKDTVSSPLEPGTHRDLLHKLSLLFLLQPPVTRKLYTTLPSPSVLS